MRVVKLLLILVPLSLCTWFIIAVIFGALEKMRMSACYENENQIWMGLMMYADDWHETLPPADRWTERIMPQIMFAGILKCPNDNSPEKCSYAFNAALSGRSLNDIPSQDKTVLIFETSRPGDAPVGGPNDVANPGRHKGGNFFTYVDGHKKGEKQTPKFGP
jgi:hypothetical protein